MALAVPSPERSAEPHLRAVPADGVDDSELVQAAKGGDRPAFAALYRRHFRAVHAIALARTPAVEVRDLVQEVFLHALQRLSSLRDGAAFGPWVCAIARKRSADLYRRMRKLEPLDDDAPARPARPADTLALLAVLRALPEAYREPLIMRLVEGMTGPEIAAHTGRTAESVRVTLHRGMKRLRAELGEDAS